MINQQEINRIVAGSTDLYENSKHSIVLRRNGKLLCIDRLLFVCESGHAPNVIDMVENGTATHGMVLRNGADILKGYCYQALMPMVRK